MRLADLNPRVIDDRVLQFECPLHRPATEEWDLRHPCGGLIQIVLDPYVSDHSHRTAGWPWHGDMSTWTITLGHSIRSGLCGAHLHVHGGVVTVDP